MELSPGDLSELRRAHQHLEHPSLAARLTSVVGTPIEIALNLLPKRWYDRLHGAAHDAIAKALDAAITSMDPRPQSRAHDVFYQSLCVASGAMGGLFGLPALLVELPVTTTVMLRSIAAIARREGEELECMEARLACMQVFALGGRTEEDDAADTGYYGIRLALALSVSRAVKHVGERGLAEEGAPALVSLVAMIASRFGGAVSQKTATQLIPLVGAAGGALINAIFMQHFQDMARSHFAVRRMERKYGVERIKREYERLSTQTATG